MEDKWENQNHDSGTISVESPEPAVVVGREEISIGSTAAPPPPADSAIKKRGRPRKYGPDGKPTATLSPMPIAASIPITGDFTGWKHNQGKPLTSIKTKQKLDFCTPVVGEHAPYSIGANFKPHVLTVTSGEDVNMKIISFAQQGAGAVCVLAANGAISNVTLCQPNSSGGTLTYEGRFDILSLSGAFMSNENGVAKGMSGGMSVSLACPDGRVLGGGLAGMLVAAGPVQVILGSFLPGHQLEPQKPKKSKLEPAPTISPPTIAAMPIFKETTEGSYSAEAKIDFTLTGPVIVSRHLDQENNGSLHASEAEVLNTSAFGVSC